MSVVYFVELGGVYLLIFLGGVTVGNFAAWLWGRLRK